MVFGWVSDTTQRDEDQSEAQSYHNAYNTMNYLRQGDLCEHYDAVSLTGFEGA